jgi:hypothetical protein
MTYQERFDELNLNFRFALEAYLKADNELLTPNGFFDPKILVQFTKAKEDFGKASNLYHYFLQYVEKNNISPEAIYNPLVN